ncbi:MAG: hypothetical protein AAB262_14335 [Elusimicrobiota bacterium]
MDEYDRATLESLRCEVSAICSALAAMTAERDRLKAEFAARDQQWIDALGTNHLSTSNPKSHAAAVKHRGDRLKAELDAATGAGAVVLTSEEADMISNVFFFRDKETVVRALAILKRGRG